MIEGYVPVDPERGPRWDMLRKTEEFAWQEICGIKWMRKVKLLELGWRIVKVREVEG